MKLVEVIQALESVDQWQMATKIFSIQGDLLCYTFEVVSVERAWTCALDVEAWLKVFHAGDGVVEHISGTKGTVGMSVLHSKLKKASPMPYRINGLFEYYVISDINVHTKQLTLAVCTDEGTSQVPRPHGKKEVSVTIYQNPEPSGFFRVRIHFNTHAKPGMISNGKDFVAAATALSLHFNYYSPKVVGDVALATEVRLV